jgi:hypothetical protein
MLDTESMQWICKHRLYNSLIKSGQKLCTSYTSKVMDNIKVNKVSGENIHVQESPVRKASDESVTQWLVYQPYHCM